MPAPFVRREELDDLCSRGVDHILGRHKADSLTADEVAVTVVDLSADVPLTGHWHGDQLMHPASVVKLFYLAYAMHYFTAQDRARNPEIDRALTNMIVDSDNDATSYIIDLLTDTTSGPELGAAELQSFVERRQVINRWFAQRGYGGHNACNKTWTFEPYGRDRQALGPALDRRNALSTNLAARLMAEIICDRIVTPDHCDWMRKILFRKLPLADDRPAHGKIAAAVSEGSKVWSKSGWTSFALHDVACVELPNGRRVVLAIFTKNHSQNGAILTDLTQFLLANLP